MAEKGDTADFSSSKASSRSALIKQIAFSCMVSLMHLAAAAVFGYTGIILPSVTDPTSDDIYMDTEQVSLYTSSKTIGCIIGSFISGPLSIRFGQRSSLLMTIPLVFIGWLISFFSYSFWMHFVSRIILGMFTSVAFANSVTYIAETVHFGLRGHCLAITDFVRQLGLFFVFLVGSSNMNWRTVGLVCGVTPIIIPSILLLFVPNSPRWLAIMGRPESEVIKSLRFFRSKEHNIQEELDDIMDGVAKSKKSKSTLDQLKLMKEKSIAKRLILLIYLSFASTFTGNHTIVSYSVIIFQSATTDISPFLSTVICGGLRVVGSFLTVVLADRFGRRPMSMNFLILTSLSTASLGLFFYLNHIGHNSSGIYWVPLVSLMSFTIFSCLCLPVLRMLRSELLPNSVRHLGTNCTYLSFFLGSFFVSLSYPFMVEGIGAHWVFWIYSINSIVMVVVIFFFLPETKGKTLEEIAKLFE